MALLKGLGDDNKFCKIISWRATDIDDIKDKSQKKFIRKMKNIYSLKTNNDAKKTEQEMISTLGHLF